MTSSKIPFRRTVKMLWCLMSICEITTIVRLNRALLWSIIRIFGRSNREKAWAAVVDDNDTKMPASSNMDWLDQLFFDVAKTVKKMDEEINSVIHHNKQITRRFQISFCGFWLCVSWWMCCFYVKDWLAKAQTSWDKRFWSSSWKHDHCFDKPFLIIISHILIIQVHQIVQYLPQEAYLTLL